MGDDNSVWWSWSEFRFGAWYVKVLYIFFFPLVPLFRWVGLKMLGRR